MQAKPSKDHSNPSSYRSITVFNSIRKLFEEAHTKRILEVAEKNHRLGETQAAYSPGRCCADNLFVLATLTRARSAPRVEMSPTGQHLFVLATLTRARSAPRVEMSPTGQLARPMDNVPDPAGIMAHHGAGGQGE